MIEISGGGVRRRRDKRVVFVVLGVFVAVFLFSFLARKFHALEGEVDAANVAAFDPGYIISDYQMSRYDSMSEAEIQAFLKSKNSCNDTNLSKYTFGNKVSYYSETAPYTWHVDNGHFVCMADEIIKSETAAKIIYQAAQDYRINPQVLIVLLQKEQGLVTDTFPNSIQYRSATGYGCPDTAACDVKYYGFKNQVRKAAELFRTVLDGGWTNYPLGENYVQYNPNRACGGSVVNIRNLATSALYRYTPYQPNAAILAGWNDGCAAYGNLNFYKYFEDWFGGSMIDGEWKEMQIPRVMEVIKGTMKVDPLKKEFYNNESANVGERGYFVAKIDIVWGGKKEVCLRTAVDEETDINRCTIMSRMKDVGTELYVVEEITPSEFSVKNDTSKFDLKTGKSVQKIDKETYKKISFSSKTYYDGEDYYQTTYDYNNGNEYFIPGKDLDAIVFVPFLNPRNLMVEEDTEFLDLMTGEICKTVKKGYIRRFATKTSINKVVYYRTEEDSKQGSFCAVLAEKVVESDSEGSENVDFVSFLRPREMRFAKTTHLFDLRNGISCDKSYEIGEKVKFTTKTMLNGEVYYRTEEDSEQGSFCAALDSWVLEI